MKLFYPEIFDEFVCTGSQCSDNCCMTDWDIEIDAHLRLLQKA